MIEPNSHMSELSSQELGDFEEWRVQMEAARRRGLAQSIGYVAAMISANVVMAAGELKDRVFSVPAIRHGASAIFKGFVAMAPVRSDPAADYARRQQSEEDQF